MDFFENVVVEYLRADRSVFVNTQCCIQLNEGRNPDTSGPHWYCDAVAVDFRSRSVFLCEITFAKPPTGLLKRLVGWHENWDGLLQALRRDCAIPADFPVRPWIFVPEALISTIVDALEKFKLSYSTAVPVPRITTLEMTSPWRYTSWNRVGEAAKPSSIPEYMR
ncbi:hypothetical protein [Burkholderia territorii]|uniref:hypothetical protein n=1 Tax=Burkholderia territorii TaxID=1503055 RepID=UPI0009BE540D|nr:hypothetical protein [Burkholderia territorii]